MFRNLLNPDHTICHLSGRWHYAVYVIKSRAREKGLLVMGPDCGTSMIAGTPLAFANVMPEGNIGVIGASGTGIQELCSQIALAEKNSAVDSGINVTGDFCPA